MVVTLSPFKANLEFSDVLLPIAPFTETPGTFVNAEGRVQSFHAVVKPLGEARPAWKVLRVLANMLGLLGLRLRIDGRSAGRHRRAATQRCARRAGLSNGNAARRRRRPRAACRAAGDSVASTSSTRIVRRAPSLQLTADARAAQAAGAEEAFA